jgi:hypothetical protein
MSTENSRSKRTLPDIADNPAPGYDTQEYSSVVASTSTHVASPCTKRGTHQPLLCLPVALHGLPSCVVHSEARGDTRMSHLQRTYPASSTWAASHPRELTCTGHSRSYRRSRGLLRSTRSGTRTVRRSLLYPPFPRTYIVVQRRICSRS